MGSNASTGFAGFRQNTDACADETYGLPSYVIRDWIHKTRAIRGNCRLRSEKWNIKTGKWHRWTWLCCDEDLQCIVVAMPPSNEGIHEAGGVLWFTLLKIIVDLRLPAIPPPYNLLINAVDSQLVPFRGQRFHRLAQHLRDIHNQGVS
jgi:hypothetical protein